MLLGRDILKVVFWGVEWAGSCVFRRFLSGCFFGMLPHFGVKG